MSELQFMYAELICELNIMNHEFKKHAQNRTKRKITPNMRDSKWNIGRVLLHGHARVGEEGPVKFADYELMSD
jgi:hypothetical protein